LRAPRANRDFFTDEKHIRKEITVMDKSKTRLGLSLSKIADCARTAFRPRTIGDPRGRAAVRASSIAAARCIVLRPSMLARDHCALRAPTVVSVRMKSASVPKPRFWIKATTVWACSYTGSQLCDNRGAPFLPQAAIIAAACRAKHRNAEAFRG